MILCTYLVDLKRDSSMKIISICNTITKHTLAVHEKNLTNASKILLIGDMNRHINTVHEAFKL